MLQRNTNFSCKQFNNTINDTQKTFIMKQLKILTASLLTLLIITFTQCKKPKTNPVDELPPETQTGANTFGCLVDGQAFKPGGASLSGGSLQCNYQYLGNGAGGGYYFILIGRSLNSSAGSGRLVGIFTDSLMILEGGRYSLKSRIKLNASANFSSFSSPATPIKNHLTDGIGNKGEIWIKKLDLINQIVSGTFWFDAFDSTNNKKVKVREGRFDMRYTR